MTTAVPSKVLTERRKRLADYSLMSATSGAASMTAETEPTTVTTVTTVELPRQDVARVSPPVTGQQASFISVSVHLEVWEKAGFFHHNVTKLLVSRATGD